MVDQRRSGEVYVALGPTSSPFLPVFEQGFDKQEGRPPVSLSAVLERCPGVLNSAAVDKSGYTSFTCA